MTTKIEAMQAEQITFLREELFASYDRFAGMMAAFAGTPMHQAHSMSTQWKRNATTALVRIEVGRMRTDKSDEAEEDQVSEDSAS